MHYLPAYNPSGRLLVAIGRALYHFGSFEPAAPHAAGARREVRALANTLVGLARNRGFSVVALQRALEEGNAVDVCRSLGLAPPPCEELERMTSAGASMCPGSSMSADRRPAAARMGTSPVARPLS